VDAVGLVHRNGGVASASLLRAAGVTRGRLTKLVSDGYLRRPRVGWYSTLTREDPKFRAVHIGGRLTGASALHDMRAWMLRPPRRLEVAVVRGSARLRIEPGAVIHWTADRGTPTSDAVVGLGEALVRVTLDHDLEVSVPCIDWSLASGRLDRFAFEQFVLALPESARCVREWVDPHSQSLLESLARVRLMRGGWRVRSQVSVDELSAIDLVVDDVVALELDGREHHEATFESDRRKDLSITIEGRHPIRVSYSMVVRDWQRIELAIEAAITARGGVVSSHSVIPPREPHGQRHARGSGRVID
jgi:very-short-patch-repair endonuclease